ncbi:MAG: DUF4870 domain-containing protein [Flavobacteriaceae bacterium]|nr:DUF4870 domain-containing protein [Flavobacteriaceae bacterium]
MEFLEKGKTIASISYITFIGGLIAIFLNLEKQDPFARFHIRQAVGLHICMILIGFLVGFIPSLYAVIGFYLFFIILWVFGFTGAITGAYKKIPLLGDLFQNYLKFIQ